jgi:hypothetical protein
VEQTEATFADFWTLFPKRIARMEAEKSWSRLSPAQRVDALVGLCAWRPVWIAENRLQFVPNASTWLNQQRWTDELPDQWAVSHASHVPFAKTEPGKREPMPEHVKAAIARLRKA